MQGIFIQYNCLISIVLGLVTIANKLRLAYPIVLVLGGLALSFIAPFSNITINPELVFLIFLPPLLYEAAYEKYCLSPPNFGFRMPITTAQRRLLKNL